MDRSISEIELVGNPYPVLRATSKSRFLTAHVRSVLCVRTILRDPRIVILGGSCANPPRISGVP